MKLEVLANDVLSSTKLAPPVPGDMLETELSAPIILDVFTVPERAMS